ncbi:hypothetical protein BRC65_03945 [Halobacteriales archaeon QH_2_65_14]|nr:MAG: hypothetical protein BRC65_03945 [Halobacteriales archaeon QH_2_65_14]
MALSLVTPHASEPTDGTADEGGVQRGGDHTCPLCGLATGEERTLYVHLQTGHRKSDIARVLLDETAEE